MQQGLSTLKKRHSYDTKESEEMAAPDVVALEIETAILHLFLRLVIGAFSLICREQEQ